MTQSVRASTEPTVWAIVTNPIIKYFKYDHLPESLQGVSKPFGDLANLLENTLPDGPEKSVALRKLLEAKDAGVRSALDD